MKTFLFYLFVVAITVYVEIMYDNSMAVTFLAFELLIGAAMLLYSWYMKFKLDASLEVRVPVAQKEQDIELEIHIRNRGFLPATRVLIWIAYENEFANKAGREPVACSAAARSDTRLPYHAFAQYCGRVHFSVKKGRIWDYLGIFSCRIKCSGETVVNVLPAIRQMQVDISERTRNFPVDGDEYDKLRSGDDPSEIFQVREFRSGDSLQRVHWKLSAKADELMTKEFSRPLGYSVLFLVDLHCARSGGPDIQQMDAFMETAASIAWSMCQENVLFYISWYDEKQGSLVRCPMGQEQQVYEMIGQLLRASCYREVYNLEEGYKVEYPEGGYSTVLRLDTDLCLWNNGKQEAVFSVQEIKDQVERLILEV